MTEIPLEFGIHPLLVSILAPRLPQICLETAVSCLRHLQSGGHSVKTRRSLKPLLQSSHFTRLKMRPWLSRFRKRQHCHSNWHCSLNEQDLRSTWWANDPHRPKHSANGRIQVPLRSFSYPSEYASNYDLWCTYRYALQLLPISLANAPPDSRLASIAADCTFNSFCTAYPRETRKAKKSITQYLSQYRPIRTTPLGDRSVFYGMQAMDVD